MIFDDDGWAARGAAFYFFMWAEDSPLTPFKWRRTVFLLRGRIDNPINLGIQAGIFHDRPVGRPGGSKHNAKVFYPTTEIDALRTFASLVREGITSSPDPRWGIWWDHGIPLGRMDMWQGDLVASIEAEIERLEDFRARLLRQSDPRTALD